jgi:hypothetical protein
MIVQNDFPIVTFDWENLRKHSLKTQILPLAGRDLGLEKFLVRIHLNLNHVGRCDYFFDFSEVDTI